MSPLDTSPPKASRLPDVTFIRTCIFLAERGGGFGYRARKWSFPEHKQGKMLCTFGDVSRYLKFQVLHACWWFLSSAFFPERREHHWSQNQQDTGLLTRFVTLIKLQPNPILWTWCPNATFFPEPQGKFLSPVFTEALWEKFIKMPLPFPLTVFDPLSHDGVVCFQVHGDIFVLWVKHVAQLLKTTVLWSPTGCMSQIINYFGHCHFS